MTRPLSPVTRDLVQLNDDPQYRRTNQCFMFATGVDAVEVSACLADKPQRLDPDMWLIRKLGYPGAIYNGYRARRRNGRHFSEDYRLFDHMLLRDGFEPIKASEARVHALEGARVMHAYSPLHFVLELPDGQAEPDSGAREEIIHKNGDGPVTPLTRAQLLEYMMSYQGCSYVGTYIIPRDRVRYEERRTRQPVYSEAAKQRMASNFRLWVMTEEVSPLECVREMKALGFDINDRRLYLGTIIEGLRRKKLGIGDEVPFPRRMYAPRLGEPMPAAITNT